MSATQISSMVEKLIETKVPRLEGHLRISYKPRSRTLVYHVEHGAGLKMNVELGGAFLTRPEQIAHRVERITDWCIQMYNGQRLATAVHVEEEEVA